jgi:release factor glutamine methyltransferase
LERGDRVDAIVSNPPYIDDADLASLAPEVSAHEPRMALAGGAGGFAVTSRLLGQVGNVLAPGGVLVMEIGKGQDEGVAVHLCDAGLSLERIAPDLAGIPRVVVARRA